MAETQRPKPEDRPVGKKVSALKALWPFIRPYKLNIIFAGFFLVFTASVALTFPIAARLVVDSFGLDSEEIGRHFVLFLIIAVLLAFGTAARYYLVTRLGERVVADIRKAVFNRMISMSPAFYERIMTGEVLSRITTDTTLILSVIGSSVSVALRNVLILVGVGL